MAKRSGRFWLRALSASLLLVLASVSPAQEAARVEVHVAGRSFDPIRDDLARTAPAPETQNGQGLRLLQLHGPIRQAQLDQLAADGVRVLQYYPHDTFLVWADRAALGRAAERAEVRWIGDFSPAWKQSPSLLGRQGLIDLLLVHYVDDGRRSDVLAALATLGGQLVQDYRAQRDGRFREALLRLPATRLASVAALPQVLWFGYQSPSPILDDEMSDQIAVGNLIQGTPMPGYPAFLNLIGLDGSGVRWSVTDDGVDQSHPDIVNQIVGGFDYAGCSSNGPPGSDGPSGGHGSHVAGILAGSGAGGFVDPSGFSYGQGVAPGSELFVQNPLCGPAASWPPLGGWPVLSAKALEGGASGTNASWTTSEGARHGYQASERLFDQLVRDGNLDTPTSEPFTFIFSSGNSGPNLATLTSPKEAKNVISVGASLNLRAGPLNQVADYSSRGPAVDGRTLPTLIAPGTSIASMRRRAGGIYCNMPIPDTDGLYAYCLGTSMAAPHVSGLAVLLTQWWREQHEGQDPSPAMLKALLVDGSRPTPDTDVRPNDARGWGLSGLPAPLRDPLVGWAAVDQTEVFDEPGEVHRYAIQIIDPKRPLQITLAWTDAPGAIGANPALVNDLDLEIEAGGEEYLGNVLSESGSEAGGDADRLHNLERVLLPAGQADTAIVRVRAAALPGDGLPDLGDDTDQDYALLCTNCALISDFDVVSISGPDAVCAPDEAVFEVELASIQNYSKDVELSLGAAPSGVLPSINPALVSSLPSTIEIALDTSGSPAEGPVSIPLQLTSAGATRERVLQFGLVAAPAGSVGLVAPAADAVVPLRPQLSWQGNGAGLSYRLEIDDDPSFGSPLIDEITQSSTFQFADDLPPNHSFHWRVTATNACGSGATTDVRTFTTGSAPGACPAGQRAIMLLNDAIFASNSDWSRDSVMGNSTWQPSEQRAHSPSHSFLGTNFGRADQRLLSPRWTLPRGEPAFARFWHWRDLESRDDERCWDGASVYLDGGNHTLIDIGFSDYLTGAPDRIISEGNPAVGEKAWCGIRDFSEVIIALDAQASSTGRLAFRLASDGLGNREGWYVDDLMIYTCAPEDVLFRNGMGAEPR
ncbi:MAG: S8 family serine peptidase [Xanthomonadales bacterium]|nr:S8 family serine peptidase [Xanthomonadales bacterium]